jgi:tetratricopeptide (TPR) repeat protein
MQPELAEANLLMAKTWMSAGQASQAAPYLERVAADHPDLRLSVAEIRAMQNDREGKQHKAQAARDELEKQLRQTPRDTKLRLQLARAYLLIEDFPKSMEVLREGLHGDDVKVVSVFLSEVLTAWSYQLGVDNGPGERRLELLTDALKHDPRNGAAIVQLLELGEKFPPLNAAVERELRNLHPDDLPPLALVALGNAAWKRGTTSVARARFEQAYLLDPSNPGSANNLAWALSHSSPLELERARQLCDDALRVAPLQKNLLDTRSDILLQLHAWQEAQADLSALARLYPEMPGVREKLEHLKTQLHGTTNDMGR